MIRTYCIVNFTQMDIDSMISTFISSMVGNEPVRRSFVLAFIGMLDNDFNLKFKKTSTDKQAVGFQNEIGEEYPSFPIAIVSDTINKGNVNIFEQMLRLSRKYKKETSKCKKKV